jgi:hypothetical protein
MLAFLPLADLPAALRSCRAWSAAVRSLPLQNYTFSVSSARQLYQLLTSPSTSLSRHIVTCDVRHAYTADELTQFLARLPRLQSLSHLYCRPSKLYPQLYSSQLRQLNIELSTQDHGETDAFVAQVKSLSSATGLHHLILALPYSVDHSRSFSLEPLECMKELESLTLRNGVALSPEQLMHIRRLPSLRTLSLGGWSQRQMEVLVEDLPNCPPLQLHAFEGIGVDGSMPSFGLNHAQLLVRMTTLQRVDPNRITPDALRILAHGLPNLHTLKANVRGVTPESGWAVVCDGLAACRQLTALTLVATPLEELAALFLALPPSMRKLDLHSCDGFLQSSAFFHCVSEGGLRHLALFRVRLRRSEFDRPQVAEWQQRRRACAPWIKTVIWM